MRSCCNFGKVAFYFLPWFFCLQIQPLFNAFCLAAVAFHYSAQAATETEAPFSFRIDLRAPSAVSALLERHLEIFALRNSPRNSPEQLNHAIDNLPVSVANLLETEGYFNSKTQARLEQTGERNLVVIEVEPGPVARIQDAQLNISGAIEDNPDRLEVLEQRFNQRRDELIGEPFTQRTWDDLKRRSLASFLARDYPASKMSESRAEIDPLQNTAHFRIDIDSGPLFVFGATEVRGLNHFPEHLVLDRVQINPGQGYRRNDLVNLQTELQNMPHFSSVLVDVDLSESEPFIAPIHINVQEAPLHRITSNIGYNTNVGAQIGVAYRYLNFLDRAWVFNSSLQLTQKEQSATTGVTLPRGTDGWEHNVNLDYLRSDIQGFLSETYRTGVSRNKTDGDIERFMSVQYVTESRELNDGTTSNPKSLTGNFRWIQRKLDSKKDPKNGYLALGEIGGASEYLLSDVSFVRLYGNGILYNQIGKDGVLLLRLELGETFSQDVFGVPSDALFRAGGVGSVRGYAYQSLGVPAGGSTAPGQVLATSTIEYQHPIAPDWRGAVFFDYGDAALDWQSFDAVGGVGVGARWQSPVGQIGADLAYGLESKRVRFEFAMGLAF
ncbi:MULTISPECIES: autotransporter assembly complex protein TamA [Deefgea]|uniref:BamA/TamA family outer membrane protein n=1 Tax=Deefgea chitinilytica TaxID=570276 RepID=A0ABS2C8J2_9NEIS|nr:MULTISPECIES: BamA/TamA family outer membrane protein [Deefgea]MBM5570465.1 BamA/TamA family outer membrane protein [Deefgea chitinilytica]MBM9887694.1 BamA/TamA family outer membrane protein [Deefgea sp. CFH1-16]